MADGDFAGEAKRIKKELLGSLKSKDALIKALKVCHIAPERPLTRTASLALAPVNWPSYDGGDLQLSPAPEYCSFWTAFLCAKVDVCDNALLPALMHIATQDSAAPNETKNTFTCICSCREG